MVFLIIVVYHNSDLFRKNFVVNNECQTNEEEFLIQNSRVQSVP